MRKKFVYHKSSWESSRPRDEDTWSVVDIERRPLDACADSTLGVEWSPGGTGSKGDDSWSRRKLAPFRDGFLFCGVKRVLIEFWHVRDTTDSSERVVDQASRS